MTDSELTIAFFIEDVSDAFVSQTVDAAQQVGLTVSTGEDGCTYWSERYGQRIADKRTDVPLCDAINDIAADQEGTIRFYHPPFQLDVNFYTDTEREWNDPRLTITVDSGYLDPDNSKITDQQQSGFIGALVSLVREISETVDPLYVCQFDSAGLPGEVFPTTKPISSDLDRIPWIGVYSNSVIDELGGREHVLNTPAWNVEELATGSILIVKTDHPVVPTEINPTDIDQYLLND